MSGRVASRKPHETPTIWCSQPCRSSRHAPCDREDMVPRIIVVGAGVAGLSIAWSIKRRAADVDVIVLERSARAGGNIRTEHLDGYVCEWGPDGFLDNAPATLALVADLGLNSRILPSNDAAWKRYIFPQPRLCEVPTSIGAFLKSPLLSTRAKLRVMGEPFAASRQEDEEPIFDFAKLHI